MTWQFNINITRHCNLNCNHCFIEKIYLKDKATTMSNVLFLESIEKIGKFLSIKENNSDARIQVIGGEPLLLGSDFWNENIPKAKEILNRYNIKNHLKVATNLISKNIDCLLLFDSVSTSWDYERFPNSVVEKLWEKNVKELHNKNLKLSVEITITKKVINSSLEDLLLYFLNLGFYDIHFSQFIPRLWTDDTKELLPKNEEVANFLIKLSELKLKYKKIYPEISINPVDTLVALLENKRMELECTDFTCPIHTGMLNIEFDGKVSGCTNDGCGGPNEFGSNLKEKELKEIYEESSIKQKIKEAKMPNKECLVCEDYDICNGGCSLVHRFWDGKGECPSHKKFIKHIKVNIERFK